MAVESRGEGLVGNFRHTFRFLSRLCCQNSTRREFSSLRPRPQCRYVMLKRVISAAAGRPTPIETEAGAVPSDDRLRLHDDEDISLAAPDGAEGRPEQSGPPSLEWAADAYV
jgi:hypothetical protein